MTSLLNSRIYSILKAIKLFTNYPDLTISKSTEVKFKTFDLIKFLCFQAIGFFLFFYCVLNQIKYLQTGSLLLDNGVNWLLRIFFVIPIVGRLSLFFKRTKIWKVIQILNRSDELVG